MLRIGFAIVTVATSRVCAPTTRAVPASGAAEDSSPHVQPRSKSLLACAFTRRRPSFVNARAAKGPEG